MTETTVKACKDCKYIHKPVTWLDKLLPIMYRCTHPSAQREVTISYVEGKVTTHYYLCEVNRNFDCGKEAKFFEPRKP